MQVVKALSSLETRALSSSSAAEVNSQLAQRTSKLLRNSFRETSDEFGQSGLHEVLRRRAIDYQDVSRDLFVGFDVSARCTGISVVDARGAGLFCKACETRREINVVGVGLRLKEELDSMVEQIKADDEVFNSPTKACSNGRSVQSIGDSNSHFRSWHVGVEECAKTFTRGRFNAKGLVKLAQINGIVQYMCTEQFGEMPRLVHPVTARAFFDLHTAHKESGDKSVQKDVKERVFDFVDSRKTAKSWVDHSGLNGRFDVSDAYLIAWYTRAHHIFSRLEEDAEIWTRFHIELKNLKPVKVRRDLEALRGKLLWEWMRMNRDLLNL